MMMNRSYLFVISLSILFSYSECSFVHNRFPFTKASSKKPNSESKYSSVCSDFKYFDQYVDHFKLDQYQDVQYKQRFIMNAKYWQKNGPIFFYTGNEGDIQLFCENAGFIWEIAEKFNALVLFAEHRYYGESLPFGKKSFEAPYISLLTSEQALADYAYLLTSLKTEVNDASQSPVIAFGGSYGGMLSAWMRMKYPNIIAGSLAASAPIFQFQTDCGRFSEVITSAFRKADDDCPSIINSSWEALDNVSKSDHGLKAISKVFNLCKPLTSVQVLKDWLADVYGNIAMVNYPYATSFLSTLPPWPVRAMCDKMKASLKEKESDHPLLILKSIFNGANVWFNYTGDQTCLNLDTDTPSSINMISWTYQTCTEFVFPSCSNGMTDMFENITWDYEQYRANCKKQFGTYPREDWPIINYGGNERDIRSHSNIIFSNGDLDPWSAGGVESDINESLTSIIIENGAHHLDLRGSNESDPESVIKARLEEIDIIQKWIDEYKNK